MRERDRRRGEGKRERDIGEQETGREKSTKSESEIMTARAKAGRREGENAVE